MSLLFSFGAVQAAQAKRWQDTACPSLPGAGFCVLVFVVSSVRGNTASQANDAAGRLNEQEEEVLNDRNSQVLHLVDDVVGRAGEEGHEVDTRAQPSVVVFLPGGILRTQSKCQMCGSRKHTLKRAKAGKYDEGLNRKSREQTVTPRSSGDGDSALMAQHAAA